MKFKEVSFVDSYTLKIPEIIYSDGVGLWKTMSHNTTFLSFGLSIIDKNKKTLDENLQDYIKSDNFAGIQEFELINKDKITSNEFTGMVYYYKKPSPTVIKVYTYLVYAVLENKNEMLGVKSVYFGKDYTKEIDSTIHSIRIKNEFEANSDVPQEKIVGYTNKGYTYFKSHKLLLKCPCELKPYTNKSTKQILKGLKNPIWTYMCNESLTHTKFKLNVSDISNDCEQYSKNKNNHCESLYLESMIQEMKNSNLNVTRGQINNVSNVEFSFKNDFQSRTMVFIKNKRLYFLYAERSPDVTSQFNNFKTSVLFVK